MPVARRRARVWPWLLALVLLAAAGWAGWQGWLLWQDQQRQAAIHADQRLEALAQRLSALRDDQRGQSQRLQQADATNRVLRDELLGFSERAALLEESVARQNDPDRPSALALRLDEAELLLSMGEQRLLIAGDLNGAQRAYALAAGALQRVDDPAFMNLRQALMQERAALEAVDIEPRVRALAQLEALASRLEAVPETAPATVAAQDLPWWRRIMADLVQVRPTEGAVASQPGDRAAARAGLQLEISLARAAAERRDPQGWREALQRADAWVERLWPASPERETHRTRLARLAQAPLSLSLPTLGSTLRELRQARAAQTLQPSMDPITEPR
ncbi:MAG: uroporphyrinogen-III C-methyltransferase [Pseudomonadota bacterium]|nr:uroporphyrinogen-III C-methyltransferase [Pseudomonadota bacterium]